MGENPDIRPGGTLLGGGGGGGVGRDNGCGSVLGQCYLNHFLSRAKTLYLADVHIDVLPNSVFRQMLLLKLSVKIAWIELTITID